MSTDINEVNEQVATPHLVDWRRWAGVELTTCAAAIQQAVLALSLALCVCNKLFSTTKVMARGNRHGGPRSMRGASGRPAPYATRSRGRVPARATPPAAIHLPRLAGSGAVDANTSGTPTIQPGQRVADMSLEDLVGVVRAVVRENRDISSTPASTTSAPQANPPSVAWSAPVVPTVLPPPIAPPVSLPPPGLGITSEFLSSVQYLYMYRAAYAQGSAGAVICACVGVGASGGAQVHAYVGLRAYGVLFLVCVRASVCVPVDVCVCLWMCVLVDVCACGCV